MDERWMVHGNAPPGAPGASVPANPVPVSALPAPPRPPGAAALAHATGPTVTVAGFWRRVGAALVDAVIVAPVLWLVTTIASWATGLSLPQLRTMGPDHWLDLALSGEPALWSGLALGAVVILVYLTLFWSMAGQTLGQRLLGVRVIDAYGDPPGPVRAAVRALALLAAVVPAGLGVLWIVVDPEKRGLHDWLAGTYAILSREPARAGSRRS